MIFTDSCPGCGAPAPLAARGMIAPFVAELIGAPIGQQTGYRQCNHCGLAFFDGRYTDSEVEGLYGDYRTPRYVRVRRSWEPWYRDSVNDAFVPGSAAVEDRVRFETEVLAGGGLSRPLRCAVDFGGDQGQFFPDLSIERRLVVDVSDKPLLAGVERIPTLQAIPEEPDLVVAAHVLEHFSDPRALLTEIRDLLAPNGLLYVEVPLERPRITSWHRSRRYGSWARLVSHKRWSFIPCDFASGVTRQLGWRIPWFGIVKQSEHINFFTSASLRSLLELSGFEVTAERAEPDARVGPLRLGRLGMAAVPAAS